MSKIYKSPLQQSIALKGEKDGIPEFDLNAIKDYYTQYGDFVTDDAYENWALAHGKQLGEPDRDALGQTRFSAYINDEDFLHDSWNEIYPEVIEYQDYLNSNPQEAASVRKWRR